MVSDYDYSFLLRSREKCAKKKANHPDIGDDG